jgi:two-component system, OmpR family, alkaline phosphatase synthesis response regulator PhoP
MKPESTATPTSGVTAPSAAPDAAAHAARPAQEVLVVEDDMVVSRLVTHLLTRRGYKVQHAADGLRAQQIVATDHQPAVVVLDVMLPYVSGFELMSQIRSTPGWDDVPVIVLTSKAHESDILRAFDSGVNDYVVKPFRPEEFVARVRRLAETRRAA